MKAFYVPVPALQNMKLLNFLFFKGNIYFLPRSGSGFRIRTQIPRTN